VGKLLAAGGRSEKPWVEFWNYMDGSSSRRTWFRRLGGRDDDATYDLTLSACLFSRRIKDAVDDTLGFAAALIRAGELDAACRMFSELDGYLRGESAALSEHAREGHGPPTHGSADR
jgi:hypothetical protein